MITFYLARADNGVIGLDHIIPWHIPGEQRRFKAMTMGKPMVMGRKTFESFKAPLPGRRHIVLTRNPDWSAPGAEVAHTREEAIGAAKLARDRGWRSRTRARKRSPWPATCLRSR